eukprot:Skav227315  [mRNA]  locus=scaffold826:42428:43798:+ [translate_table: standard]
MLRRCFSFLENFQLEAVNEWRLNSEVEEVSIYERLRSEFREINPENKGYLTILDFFKGVKGCAQVPAQAVYLQNKTVDRCFIGACVRGEKLQMEDWLHFGLLPSASSAELTRRLQSILVRNPRFLMQVIDAFEAADVRGVGCLRIQDMATLKLRLKTIDIEGSLDFAELMQEVELRAKNPGQDKELSYHEFVAFCLGFRRTPVKLNWYDITGGYAKYMPGLLHTQGIWHTGIVAFGREYWFSGKVLSCDDPKSTFGEPDRSTVLGSTLRSKEEFEEWLHWEACRYSPANYDLLGHNCNHFSFEAASSFLLQGCIVPDEACRQPKALIGSAAVAMASPLLKRWLGAQEKCHWVDEWRGKLRPGELCLVQEMSGNQQMMLAQVSKVDAANAVCEIIYWKSARSKTSPDWRLHAGFAPISSLFPHENARLELWNHPKIKSIMEREGKKMTKKKRSSGCC